MREGIKAAELLASVQMVIRDGVDLVQMAECGFGIDSQVKSRKEKVIVGGIRDN